MRQFVVDRSLIAVAVIILFASSASRASAQAVADMPFFPGAEGFGGNYTGAAPAGGWYANGQVYHVTKLDDITNLSDPAAVGTLRHAIRESGYPAGGRIIVFDVGGVIKLNDSLDIKNLPRVYIAGQTAPSPITIYGDMTQITSSPGKVNQNVVMRYMSFRKGTGDSDDAITFAGGGLGTNLILDHVSASWAEDENMSVANNNTNVTVQYSIIHDALVSNHAYGSLIRPRIDSSVTFHHNLYAHNSSRQARFGTYFGETLTADFRNNVVYNWRDRASYAGGSDDDDREKADVNYVGNYLVAGPNSLGHLDKAFDVDQNIDARVYQSGNFIDGDKLPNPGGMPNGSNIGEGMFQVNPPGDKPIGTLEFMDDPFSTPPVTTQTAINAYNQIIDHVGSSWRTRESNPLLEPIEARVIDNVLNFAGPPGGIAQPGPYGPELGVEGGATGLINTPTTSRPAGYDTDNDGMSNEWETEHGLNTGSAADAFLDFDNDGYINVLEFVNELGEFPAPAPIVFNGALNSRYAHVMNWKTNDGGVTAGSNWQPSKYYEAQINSGTVVVDAVGQHAGVLKIGATAGSNGHLQVNSGWLEVADTVVVGAHETGQGILTMGGGQLIAEEVEVGFLGQLRGTGTLEANVTNSGAVLPGTSPGTLTIAGNYTQNMDGVLSLELASLASFDKLVVNGDIAYGGALEVLSPDYSPVLNDSFNLIDWTGVKSGFFEMLSLPGLDEGLEWDLSQLDTAGVLSVVAAAPVGLAGDYNDDGVVDAVDYTVWRNNLGDETEANINDNGDGMNGVDLADFDWWKQHYGDMAELGAGGLASSVVPEPASISLALLALLAFAFRSRSERRP